MGRQKSAPNQAVLKGKIRHLENSLAAARGCGLSAERLRSEKDFLSYMCLLKDFARRYCVMIAACDTPVGPLFSQDMANAVMAIGLNVNLYQKYRCAYATVIDSGVILYENIRLNTSESIYERLTVDGSKIELESVGYNASVTGRSGSIKISGKEHSHNKRGLNIVVYDKVTQIVIDSVNFDTYLDHVPCFRSSNNLEGIKRFAKKHPDVMIVCHNHPHFPTKNLTPGERNIKENDILFTKILTNLNQNISPISHYFDKNGVLEVLTAPKSYHDIHGVRHFEDKRGRYVNIVGGHRVTPNQPSSYCRTLYCTGGCLAFGIGTDDSRTVAAYLQDMLNQKLPSCGIKVQNYGFFLGETDKITDDYINVVNSLPVKPGDIVLFELPEPFDNCELPYIDLSRAAVEPRNYEVFIDKGLVGGHLTPDGYRLEAEKLFEALSERNIFQNFDSARGIPLSLEKNSYNFDRNDSEELTEYKKILTNWYQEMFGLTMGAIVMNCNPFTLGHRYLIEKALEQCDYLIIFVVQEDKSAFPFEDRLKLIDEGVADLKNVAVIPSGRFVLSSLTFSEYFNKSEMQERIVDTSLDITIFAREIAPCLDIKKRFAGEEPFDSITRQYNETMRTILPEYGIEFVEIPRLKVEGGAVSASRVRTLLEEENFDAIKPLVPESTFQYLCTLAPNSLKS